MIFAGADGPERRRCGLKSALVLACLNLLVSIAHFALNVIACFQSREDFGIGGKGGGKSSGGGGGSGSGGGGGVKSFGDGGAIDCSGYRHDEIPDQQKTFYTFCLSLMALAAYAQIFAAFLTIVKLSKAIHEEKKATVDLPCTDIDDDLRRNVYANNKV